MIHTFNRKQGLLLVITGVILFTYGCDPLIKHVEGNGEVISQSRNIGSFEELTVTSSMHVFLSQGPVQAARIEAESNLIPYIITRKEGNKMVIKQKDNTFINSLHEINIYLVTPDVRILNMAGSGKIIAKDTLVNDEEIKISMAGSGTVNVPVKTPKVEASLAGSGEISLAGFTRDLDINIAGSGNLKATDLKSENATVKILGSGSAWVFASVNLESDILGSGDVHYQGNPALDSKTVGSGRIIKEE